MFHLSLTPRQLARCLEVLLALSGLTMIIGSIDPDHPAIYRVALGVATLAGTGLMMVRTGVSTRMLERARQHGYDCGYNDGCEVRRDNVIALVSPVGDAPLAVNGPPQ